MLRDAPIVLVGRADGPPRRRPGVFAGREPRAVARGTGRSLLAAHRLGPRRAGGPHARPGRAAASSQTDRTGAPLPRNDRGERVSPPRRPAALRRSYAAGPARHRRPPRKGASCSRSPSDPAPPMSTVALMACSGALIDKAALRPPLYTLTVLMAGVQILALGRGPLRYGERLFSHDSALQAIGRLRLWLYDEVEPRTPAALGHWRSGDLLSRATADVDSLQDLALRGISPVLVGVISSAVRRLSRGDHPAGWPVSCSPVASRAPSASPPPSPGAASVGLGAKEAALRGELSADVVELFAGSGGPGGLRARRGVPRAGPRATTKPSPASPGAARGPRAPCPASASSFTGLAVVGLLARRASRPSTPIVSPATCSPSCHSSPSAPSRSYQPVADAVSRLSHHLGAARRVLAIAELPTPGPRPDRPTGRTRTNRASSLKERLPSATAPIAPGPSPASRCLSQRHVASPSSGRAGRARAAS